MSEKEEVIKEKLDHSGLFDFKGLYSFAHGWLSEDKNYGVVEEKYSEKVSGNSREINIEWVASKRVSDYFKFEIKIRYSISGLTDVEAEIDGEKKRLNKGKISLSITGNLIKDPESKWDKQPLTRFFRDIYNKYVIPGRVFSMESIIEKDVITLKEELKAFLELVGRR